MACDCGFSGNSVRFAQRCRQGEGALASPRRRSSAGTTGSYDGILRPQCRFISRPPQKMQCNNGRKPSSQRDPGLKSGVDERRLPPSPAWTTTVQKARRSLRLIPRPGLRSKLAPVPATVLRTMAAPATTSATEKREKDDAKKHRELWRIAGGNSSQSHLKKMWRKYSAGRDRNTDVSRR